MSSGIFHPARPWIASRTFLDLAAKNWTPGSSFISKLGAMGGEVLGDTITQKEGNVYEDRGEDV